MSRIRKFVFTEVIVPAKSGAINSEGVYKPLHMLPVTARAADTWSVQFDELPKLIMEMHLENGIIGLGEFYRDHNPQLVQGIAESLAGRDILEIPLQKLPIGLYREYDGFECAVWDAYAKLKAMSITDLLGGAVRSKIKVGSWSSYRRPGELGPAAAAFQKQGYDCIKLKAALDDPVVPWAEEVLRDAPGMSIIYDPNQRWENLGEVKYILRSLERVGNVMILEDPLPLWMLDDYRRLREQSSIRIVRHISLPYIYQGQRSHDIISCIRHGSADGFNFNAGLHKFRILDSIASTAGMYSWHGSEIDLGILEAMYVHQVHAASSCIWPSDIFGRLIRCHDLLKTPIRIENSYAYPPSAGHGLGVELDPEALERYRRSGFEVS